MPLPCTVKGFCPLLTLDPPQGPLSEVSNWKGISNWPGKEMALGALFFISLTA